MLYPLSYESMIAKRDHGSQRYSGSHRETHEASGPPVNPGGNIVVAASTINWFGPNQNLANGILATLNANREVTVIAGGGGTTHFVLDVNGYFL